MNFGTIIRGEVEKLKSELKQGININELDEFGNTALHIAAEQGFADMAELLLNNNADLEIKGLNHYTPLLYAVSNFNNEMVLLLLRHGANVNCQDDNGNSAILTAVMKYSGGDYSVIQSLLNNDADPNIPNNHGVTPFRFINMPAKKDLAPLFEAYQK